MRAASPEPPTPGGFAGEHDLADVTIPTRDHGHGRTSRAAAARPAAGGDRARSRSAGSAKQRHCLWRAIGAPGESVAGRTAEIVNVQALTAHQASCGSTTSSIAPAIAGPSVRPTSSSAAVEAHRGRPVLAAPQTCESDARAAGLNRAVPMPAISAQAIIRPSDGTNASAAERPRGAGRQPPRGRWRRGSRSARARARAERDGGEQLAEQEDGQPPRGVEALAGEQRQADERDPAADARLGVGEEKTRRAPRPGAQHPPSAHMVRPRRRATRPGRRPRSVPQGADQEEEGAENDDQVTDAEDVVDGQPARQSWKRRRGSRASRRRPARSSRTEFVVLRDAGGRDRVGVGRHYAAVGEDGARSQRRPRRDHEQPGDVQDDDEEGAEQQVAREVDLLGEVPPTPGRIEMISTWTASAARASHARRNSSSPSRDSRPPVSGTDRMQSSRAAPINIRAISTPARAP